MSSSTWRAILTHHKAFPALKYLMMGNSVSTAPSTKGKEVAVVFDGDAQIYQNPKTQVKLQQPLVDRLFEVSDEPPSASRQAALDSSIQNKLRSDRERLNKLKDEVDMQVRTAFQKQGSSVPTKDGENLKSSAQLMEELSSVKEKLHQHRVKNASDSMPEINTARKAIVTCLRQHNDQPLKCTQEVDNFKKVVRNLESKFVVSMQ